MAKGVGRRERVDAGTTAQVLVPLSEQRSAMAWAGMRYGDPSLPRYATGKADGRAPALDACRVTIGVVGAAKRK